MKTRLEHSFSFLVHKDALKNEDITAAATNLQFFFLSIFCKKNIFSIKKLLNKN